MIWMSQTLFDKLKKLLGGGDDIKTADDVMEHLENMFDKTTPETMSLSRNETAQLATNLAGLRSLAALETGLASQHLAMGLPATGKIPAAQIIVDAMKKRVAAVRGPDKEVCDTMLGVAGGLKIGGQQA